MIQIPRNDWESWANSVKLMCARKISKPQLPNRPETPHQVNNPTAKLVRGLRRLAGLRVSRSTKTKSGCPSNQRSAILSSSEHAPWMKYAIAHMT